MAKKYKIITGVDIGTTDVRAVISKFYPDKGIEIIGVASVKSTGVKKSEILSAEEIVPLVRIAIENAENDANIETNEVYITIGGGHITSSHTSSVVNIIDGEETVNEVHLNELIRKAKDNAKERGRSIIHCIPQEYRLDGKRGIQNPLGLQAARIEGAFHIVSADKTILENHGRIINDGGFIVKGICFSIIATGNSLLDKDEKKDGVLIVDVGAGSTSYAIYCNNTICYSNVFGVGGDHITNDLALGLQLNYNDAENLKSTYSLFTGGTTKLFNFSKRAEKIFSMPIEIKTPKIFSSEENFSTDDIFSDKYEILSDTTYSTVLGLVKYACQIEKNNFDKKIGFWKRLFGN